MNDSESPTIQGKKPVRGDDVLRRAALVLVSLDDRQAADLLAKMSPRQVEAITAAIENLNEIDPIEQADALREFYGRMGMNQPIGSGPEPVSQVNIEEELAEDLRVWPTEAIRFAFDPAAADDWALALADCEHDQIRRILKALSMRDRRLLAEADRRRGPWKLHEPHDARERIRVRFARTRAPE
ncbi:hypothetical protein GC170_05425 [bacterium]|nr:hypothetical protein [bacterium]